MLLLDRPVSNSALNITLM